jgi:tRNA A37 threonylcarbamoyladenosine synthetase subunit TsaC/SUA5/YrdC
MPNHRVALEILSETGPLAVSSANLTGEPAALTAMAAEQMLGDSVAVYLEAGTVGTGYPAPPDQAGGTHPLGSTIVDATGLLLPEGKLRIVRHGVISDEDIRAIVGERCE